MANLLRCNMGAKHHTENNFELMSRYIAVFVQVIHRKSN